MSTIRKLFFASALLLATIHGNSAGAHDDGRGGLRFIQVAVDTKEERSRIADSGMSIEFTRSDSVWGFANKKTIARIKGDGFKILGNFDYKVGRGGHEGLDFPPSDSKFHNYKEMTDAIKMLRNQHPDLATVKSIGKSLEGRDIWAIHINTTPEAHKTGLSAKPGAIFMGNHHAREHLSAEIPFMLAKHLLSNRDDTRVASLLDTRDIWIIPMVNPDGVEFDISTGKYKWWRKNRRDNGDGSFGVDLNRNYSYKWGTGGSSDDTSNETYKGTEPFSEPETQVIRDFVNSHLNAKVLLTFHTFSELILYPWGHSYDSIAEKRDLQVFEKMAKTMSGWNGYTPQQASDLYIASGDTTDWAYGEHGIFAFTFELSPKDQWSGGFYPGQAVIEKVFEANLKPCLFMLDVADDPYKVLDRNRVEFLPSLVAPRAPAEIFWQAQPL